MNAIYAIYAGYIFFSIFYIKYSLNTVGSKTIRALEISRVKNLVSNAILWNKYLSSHDLQALYYL